MTGPTCAERFGRRILLSVPHMGGAEAGYVRAAFASNWLSTVGPNLEALERDFGKLIGLPAVALVSGTAGIHLGVKLAGLKPGDEMVTPTLTFAATCNPVLYEGAVPVFVDSDRSSWNLDPNLLADFLRARAAVNRLPKAVTVVHLFGQSADLTAILDVCGRYGLPLIEDAAHSLGGLYQGRPTGSFGQVGVFSLSGNKIITSTGGGMLVSPRGDWVEKARFWSAQARDADPAGGNYLHSELGYNYRLSNVLAGIALGQMEVLEERVRQRRAVFERYLAGFAELAGIEAQPEARYGGGGLAGGRWAGDEGGRTEPGGSAGSEGLPRADGPQPSTSNPQPTSRHTRWLSCFLIDEKEFGMSAGDLIRYLDGANIQARPVWKPMHTQRLYQGYECAGGSVAEDLNRRGICLPSSSSLTEAEQEFVIDRVRAAHFGARGAAVRKASAG